MLFAAVVIVLTLSVSDGLGQSVNFVQDEYQASIDETAPGEPVPTAPILNVMCEDDITGDPATNVDYSLRGDIGPFVIDPTSGVLTTSMTLDYETRTSYTFMAVCANSSDQSDSATSTVRIQILPVNEYRPMIHENSISQDVNESIPVNTIIISTDNNGIKEFTVTDQDASPDGIVTFSFRNLTSSPNVPHFSLNRTSGALVVSQNLDVDTLNGVTDTIRFEIIACDEDPPVPECPRLNVSISITATNDNPPRFPQDITQPRTFPDTATEVGTVLLTANCTDADRGVGEFSNIIIDIATTDNIQMWNLNRQTGALTLAQSLDYDTAWTHRINLRCIDTGSPPKTATATITIDVERNAPPVFATDRYNVTFPQEAEVGSVIGQVSCSDNEKQVASYRFFNPSAEVNETFRVNNSGALILIGSLDVCEQSRYELTILCLDSVDQTSNATVQIDIDRGRIYFENCTYTFEFDRFTMLNNEIGQVRARSREGGDPQYALVEDNQFFSIDNNGRILLANYILLIQGSNFTFEVEASIDGAEQMNDIATVTINVRGPLSVLDVIIIAAAGVVLLIVLVLLSCIVGCCCCCRGNKTSRENWYEEVSPPSALPEKGHPFRASVTVPNPEYGETAPSGQPDDDIGHSTENLMEPAKSKAEEEGEAQKITHIEEATSEEKEGDTILLQEEKPSEDKKSETLGTTAM